MAVVLSVVFGTTIGEAAENEPTHYIGLHDRLLDFKDVRVIDNDMKVPLSEITKVLYIPVEQEKGVTYLRKRGIVISYDESTKLIIERRRRTQLVSNRRRQRHALHQRKIHRQRNGLQSRIHPKTTNTAYLS